MISRICVSFLLVLAPVSSPVPAQAADLDAAVEVALEKGIAYVLRAQEIDGSWRGPQADHYRVGMTSLALYTLLKCGLPADHPAIRAGLAHVRAHLEPGHYAGADRVSKTYELGCALMAFAALPKDRRPMAEIRACAERLRRTFRNGDKENPPRWGYPNDHGGGDVAWTDLSNTQYAILGLRAAARCGCDVTGEGLWSAIAEDLIRQQAYRGGWGYQDGHKASASMTVAGITCLQVSLEMLQEKGVRGLGRIRSGVSGGYEWLAAHWSVSKNLDPRAKGQNNSRWHYYYLYGLERIGAFTGRRLVGTHDWYREGARFIVDKQGGNGGWGWGDDDTCFALLFLRRGSRSTGLSPRARARQVEDAKAALRIAAEAGTPLRAWVRDFGPGIREAVSGGARVRRLDWRDGKRVLTSVEGQDLEGLLGEAGILERRFERNGVVDLNAVLWVEGKEPFVSHLLPVVVDDVEEPWHREAIADAGQDRLRGHVAQAEASSEWSGRPARHAVDAHFGTSWLPKNEDQAPTLRLRLRSGRRGNLLKLAVASPYPQNPGDWARPRDVSISINGGKPMVVRLPDEERRKLWVRFSKRSVRTIEIRILTSWGGRSTVRHGGLRGIELFEVPKNAAPEGLPLAQEVRVVRPFADPEARWSYTFEEPGEGWTAERFADHRWERGPGGFGTEGVTFAPVRSAWSSRRIWMRDEFKLRDPKAPLYVELNHDDDARVWINGVLAVEAPGYSKGGTRTLAITPKAQAALLRGRNTIAVTATNIGGAGYVGLGLIQRGPR